MKRALAIAVAVCTFGVAGFSQIVPITGSWEASIGFLPTTVVVSTLTLNYTLAGWTLTSVSQLTGAGFAQQMFSVTGAFGPFTMTGRMWFLPTVPEYMASDLAMSFDFGGVALGLTVRHWDTDYNARFFADFWRYMWPYSPWYVPDVPVAAGAICVQTGEVGMQYIFTATVAPLTVRTLFIDCYTEGIEFHSTLLTLADLPFCCGITFDAEVSFLKATGFNYIEFSGYSIPIALGVVLDVEVRYAVAEKRVTLTPRLPDVAACFTVWWEPVYADHVWSGIRLEGFRIRCEIGDCNFIEYIHAFSHWEVNEYLQADLPAHPLGDMFADRLIMALFIDGARVDLGENQLIRLGFCGPGCCGGTWTAEARIFFGTGGGLFDLTRFVFVSTVPVMANLDVTASATLLAVSPGVAAALSRVWPNLRLGWTLRF